MKITGSCFCNAIDYEAEVDEASIGICHCRDCQILSGSAFRTSGIVAPDKFKFTRGTPKYFEKTADSGFVRLMAFCDNCGTHLCSMPKESAGGFVSIRVASSHQFDQLKPAAEIFCASRVAWLPGLRGSVEFAGMFSAKGK